MVVGIILGSSSMFDMRPQPLAPAGVERRFTEPNSGDIEPPVQNYVLEAQSAEALQLGSATR